MYLNRFSRTRQTGISLLEVLIAVLVLAIGLLGIAGLQSSALSNNFISYQYTQAATLTQSMLERMRANRLAITDGDYNLAAGMPPANPSVSCASPSAKCLPKQQADWDLAVWYASIQGQVYSNAPTLAPQDPASVATGALPNSAASINCPVPYLVNSICTVTVYWDANRTANPTSSTLYSCNPSDDSALRCFRLAFRQ